MEVYFVDGLRSRSGDTAFCTLVDGKYKIEIDEDENGDSKCYLLMHEWAHALAKPWEARVHHSEEWGVQFSRCYRVAVEGWRPR